jgi:hypothetical protein
VLVSLADRLPSGAFPNPTPELVQEAKRLRGTSPRPDRSLREIAVELEKLGYVNERGAMFSPSSVASILGLTSTKASGRAPANS